MPTPTRPAAATKDDAPPRLVRTEIWRSSSGIPKKDSKSPAVIEAYLERYPNGTFTALARVFIANQKEPGPKVPEPAKVAALPVPETNPQPAPDPQVLTRAVQAELKRVGCDPGPVDGKWSGKTKEALGDFARSAKVTLPTTEPSGTALEALASRKERVCPLECDKGERQVNGKCVAEAKPAKKVQTAKTKERDDPPPSRPRASSSERSSGAPAVGGGITIGIGRRGGIGIGF